jgi:hypothetical protein
MFKNGIKMTFFGIFYDYSWRFCVNKTHLTFSMKMPIKNTSNTSKMMKFFNLMYYKCSKLKVHLVKSYLILFKKWTCLKMNWNFRKDNFFGYPNLDCPQSVCLVERTLANSLNIYKQSFDSLINIQLLGAWQIILFDHQVTTLILLNICVSLWMLFTHPYENDEQK